MTKNFRCAICNRVSNTDIETNAHEIVHGDFFQDEKHQINVCSECQAIHRELMNEYDILDGHKFNR